MPYQRSHLKNADRSCLAGVGAVSLLVMATVLIGAAFAPTVARRGADRAHPTRQVEQIRQIAESFVRAASKRVRVQHEVPSAIVALTRQSFVHGDVLPSGWPGSGEASPLTMLREGLLNLPPPARVC